MDNLQALLAGFGLGAASGAAAVGGILKYFQHRGDIKGKSNAIAANALLRATDDIADQAEAVNWLMSNHFRPHYKPGDQSDINALCEVLGGMFPKQPPQNALRNIYEPTLRLAAPLYNERLIQILDEWNMSRWVLRGGWPFSRARRLLTEFPAAVDALRILAGSWYVEAEKWKQNIATPDEWNDKIAFDRTKQYAQAFDAFLQVKQEVHLCVEPMAFAYQDAPTS